jgi:hypothetical protein
MTAGTSPQGGKSIIKSDNGQFQRPSYVVVRVLVLLVRWSVRSIDAPENCDVVGLRGSTS